MTDRLSAVDAGFWHIDSETSRQAIAALSILGSAPDLDTTRQQVQALVETYPRLRDVIVEGSAPTWEPDPHFDLSRHVFLHEQEFSSSSELYAMAAEQFSRPLPKDRPQWRFVLFSKRRENSETDRALGAEVRGAVLFHFHHALTDGIGGLTLLGSLMEGESRLSKVRSRRENRFDREPKSRDRWRELRTAATLTLRELTRSATARKEKRSPLKGRNSSKRELSCLTISATEFRAVATNLGVTTNDLFLGLIVTALKRLNLCTDGKEFTALIPMSVRTLSNRYELGNHLIAIGIPLPLRCPTAEATLQEVSKRTEPLRSRLELASYELLASLGSRLPIFLRRKGAEFFLSRTELICTNMPGPKPGFSLGGAPVLAVFGAPALLKGQGMTVCLITYGNVLCLSAVSDPNIVSQGHLVVEEMKERFIALRNSTADLATATSRSRA